MCDLADGMYTRVCSTGAAAAETPTGVSLDLGGGNEVTILGVTSLTAADFQIV